MSYRIISRPALALALAGAMAVPICAGEYAILATGFRIHAESHQRAGDMIRLHTRDGVTEIPAAAVLGFEAEEYQPLPPAETAASSASRAASENAVAPSVKSADPKLMVRDAALRSGLPPALVSSVAAVESDFRPDALSPKGAIGVMQLMPATARKLFADPHDTAQNIDAGARLLRELLIKYDGDVVKALSAYNAGEAAVERYKGMPPYAETQDYVYKVVKTYLKNGGQPAEPRQ
jgi:soluble lytic murein transglycosylase-like protein